MGHSVKEMDTNCLSVTLQTEVNQAIDPAVGRATEVCDFCYGKSSLWKLSRRDKAIVENRCMVSVHDGCSLTKLYSNLTSEVFGDKPSSAK